MDEFFFFLSKHKWLLVLYVGVMSLAVLLKSHKEAPGSWKIRKKTGS